MRYFIFIVLSLCFFGCHYKTQPAVQQAIVDTPSDIYFPGLPKTEVDSPEVPEPPQVIYPFKYIKDFPVIKDTNAFIKELIKSCVLGIDDFNPSFKKDITYYKRIQINGSNKDLILLEYDYHEGCGAAFPWKYQLLFTETGKLVKSLGAIRFEMIKIFPDQKPFLLAVISTNHCNGGHQIWKFSDDTLENVYDGYKDYETKTYDCNADYTIFEPYELKIKIKDYDHDGFNDISLNGKLLLTDGIDSAGMDYNGTFSEENPFIKIPVEYIFVYDKKTKHFVAKEPYSIDGTITKMLKDSSSALFKRVRN